MARVSDAELLAKVTSNEGGAGAEVAAVRKARQRSNALVPLGIVVAAIVAVVVLAFSFGSSAYAVNVSRGTYIAASKEHTTLEREWNRVHEEAIQLLTNCSATVDDAALCEALDEAVTRADEDFQVAPERIDPYSAQAKEVESTGARLLSVNSALKASIDDLKSKMEPIYGSVASKTESDYENALGVLDGLVKDSRDLVNKVSSEVRDENEDYADSIDETVSKLRENAVHLNTTADQAERKLDELRAQGKPGSRDVSVLTKDVRQTAEALANEKGALADQFDSWKRHKELEEAKASASASASAAAAEKLRQAEASASASASAQAQEIERLRRSQLQQSVQVPQVQATQGGADEGGGAGADQQAGESQ